MAYLLSVVAVYAGLGCLVLGGTVALLGILLIGPGMIFCGYLAQRERAEVAKGDYLIDYRIGWRRSTIFFGALVLQAVGLLRGR